MAGRIVRYLDRQRPQIAMGADLHDPRAFVRGDQVCQIDRHVAEQTADRVVAFLHQYRRSRSVEQLDHALAVDRQHASSHARQDRFDKGAAFVQLAVGGDQRPGLRLQPLGHAIEGGRQRADFVAGKRAGDTRGQITRRDPAGRRHQFIDRPDHPVGNGQRDIDRNAHQQQRSHKQGDVEAEL